MARIWLTFSAIGAVFCFLVVRLFYWQVIRSPELRLEAASQYYFTFTLPAQRGAILASDFKPLVLNQSAYLAYAQPKDIRDIAGFSTQVSSILGSIERTLRLRCQSRERCGYRLRIKSKHPASVSFGRLH